jgi:hypothetical protein
MFFPAKRVDFMIILYQITNVWKYKLMIILKYSSLKT